MKLEQKFLDEINRIYDLDAQRLIIKAFNFADQKHSGQMRDSGEEYITHPYQVAKILVGMQADVTTVVSGFLHDCLEDTECSENEILNSFGGAVLNILKGMAKIELIKEARIKNIEENENLRKMFLTLSKDARVAFVKLADRLHNMQTLEFKAREKQVKIAKETLDIYVPLAERLGMNNLKHDLEDLCFRYIFPTDYVETKKYLEEYYQKSQKISDDINSKIKLMAKEAGIDVQTQHRLKSAFGVFRKWQIKGKNSVFDYIAHRIIVKDVKDCYAMLGAVHNQWKPVEGRIKDYIAKPKKNLYRSLHTTVLYPTEQGEIPFEIQIRTEEMHIYCEYGMAAHWMYKEAGSQASTTAGNSAMYNLKKDANAETEDQGEDFLQIIKTGFYSNKMFVFSPNFNVIELPEGSIPIDFAYAIHSNLGNRCVGARINGKMVQLTTKLQTGDMVEIITSTSSKGPSRDWLKIVKSREAISKIKAFFKKERREENIKIGREILEEYAKNNGYTLSKLFEDKNTLAEIQKKYHLATLEEIFIVVGYGGLTSAQVLGKFVTKIKQEARRQKKYESMSSKRTNEGVMIGGHSDLLKKFAKCCNPIPGDEIVGYVSRGKGVTVHRADCASLSILEKERIIKTDWNNNSSNEWYDASFKVIVKNSVGVLASISNKIAENKIDINYISSDSKAGEEVVISIGVKIKSREQLTEVINKIRALSDVYDVYR